MNRLRIWAFLQKRAVGGCLVIAERMNYSPILGVRVPEGRHCPQSPQIELCRDISSNLSCSGEGCGCESLNYLRRKFCAMWQFGDVSAANGRRAQRAGTR